MSNNRIKKAFNKAAESYDDYCHLQRQTGRQLITQVKEYHLDSSRMLDLGCGTGIVTRELAAAFTFDEFFAVDIADQLLLKALIQLHDFPVKVIEADFNKPLALGHFN